MGLLPFAAPLLSTLRESGASASCWSGAGSTMLGLVTNDVADDVAVAARDFLAEHGVPGSVLTLDVDRSGLVTN
jgi:homoserine kinase